MLKVKAKMIIPDKSSRHAAVWPEMLDALRRTGWHNYSLFMAPDGRLFGYFETPHDLRTAAAGMSEGGGQRPLAGVDGPLLREPRRQARR